MWRPVDTEFFAPQTPVAVCCLPESGGRGENLRSLLESLGCVVLLHSIGTPGDFLKVIAQTLTAPRYFLIVGHGLPEGLFFGTYAEGLGIDISMLHGECLPADAIRAHVQLAGTTIIADCCYGAAPSLVDAFLSRGAAAYIGTNEALGIESDVFLVNFFYRALTRREADPIACAGAIAATGPEVQSIRYYAGDVVSSI